MSVGRHGASIEEALSAIVAAAVAEQMRPAIERLHAVEARLQQLEPDETGLTYKQAAAALSVSAKTIARWVDSNKLLRGGTRGSPRIPRSEVRRLLHGLEPNASTKPARAENEPDLTALARGMLSAGAKRPHRV